MKKSKHYKVNQMQKGFSVQDRAPDRDASLRKIRCSTYRELKENKAVLWLPSVINKSV